MLSLNKSKTFSFAKYSGYLTKTKWQLWIRQPNIILRCQLGKLYLAIFFVNYTTHILVFQSDNLIHFSLWYETQRNFLKISNSIMGSSQLEIMCLMATISFCKLLYISNIIALGSHLNSFFKYATILIYFNYFCNTIW